MTAVEAEIDEAEIEIATEDANAEDALMNEIVIAVEEQMKEEGAEAEVKAVPVAEDDAYRGKSEPRHIAVIAVGADDAAKEDRGATAQKAQLEVSVHHHPELESLRRHGCIASDNSQPQHRQRQLPKRQHHTTLPMPQ